MRAVLIFSPCANPTYMPLGIASLSAFIKANKPDCQLNIVDLNIITWNLFIDREKEYQNCRNFLKGFDGNFFDETQYQSHHNTWKKIIEIHDLYIQAAKLYLENNIINDEYKSLLDYYAELILANNPRLVGFSVMYPRQILTTLALAKFIYSRFFEENNPAIERNKPMIIIGGAMMSALYSEEILQTCPFVNAVFEGEGELGFSMLCEKQEFSKIPGLVHRGSAGIIRNKKTDTISLSNIPLSDFSEFDFNLYLNPEPVIPIVFSRGCKWRKCRFCAHNFSYSGYRRRNTVSFVENLIQLNKKIGARHFYFADQYIDAADMKIIAEEILHRDLKIYFQIMGRPMDDYTPEIFQLLYKAGCRWISWGIESGSQRILDVCLKGTSVETIRKVVIDSHLAGISNLLMLILGLPTAGEEDFKATLEMLDDLGDAVDTVNFSSFQLFDKTAFAIQAKMLGLKITGREKIFSNELGSLHTHRLLFKEIAADGTIRPPRKTLEATQWQQRKLWSGRYQNYHVLNCEHYLLYAAHQRNIPDKELPDNFKVKEVI